MHLLLLWPMRLKFQIRFCQEPTTKPAKNPGRLESGKMLAERNALAREAKKNQKPPEVPTDEGKRSQRTQAEESTAFSFLTLESWLSPHWAFIISERQLWPPFGEPLNPAKMLRLKREQLKWPQLLQADPGREFMGAVTKEMEKYKTNIGRGWVDILRDQAIVERFNRTIAERLFGHQYAAEMWLPEGQRSSEWVVRLSAVVSALNGEVGRKRVTDLIWCLKVYHIKKIITKPNEPILYYLHDVPKRGFVREELLVVPADTELQRLPHSSSLSSSSNSIWYSIGSVRIPSSRTQRLS